MDSSRVRSRGGFYGSGDGDLPAGQGIHGGCLFLEEAWKKAAEDIEDCLVLSWIMQMVAEDCAFILQDYMDFAPFERGFRII